MYTLTNIFYSDHSPEMQITDSTKSFNRLLIVSLFHSWGKKKLRKDKVLLKKVRLHYLKIIHFIR